jgi:hypothetical protein
MSSYKDRRESRARTAGKRSNPGQSRDTDRISFVGSVRSDMTGSVLERKLSDAQAKIKHLENVTNQQQQTIDKLMSLISSSKRRM